MRIRCEQCVGCLPIVDKLELNLRYLSQEVDDAFSKFVGVVRDAGFTPIRDRTEKGEELYRVKELDVSIFTPDDRHSGYGLLLVNQPTEEKLQHVQAWLDLYFKDYEIVMSDLVKLHQMEFAFDFYFQNGRQDDYAALAMRLCRSIYPLHAQNLFAAAIVGEEYRCGDGARDGTLTIYIQGTERDDRMKPSDKLRRNDNSTQHTKLYSKRQDGIWGLRIEQTPSQPKLMNILKKHHIPFNPTHISSVLEICHHLPFEYFYTFKQADPLRFAKLIPPLSQIPTGKRIDAYRYKAFLEETALMPVADAMRAMNVVRARYDIHPQKKGRCIKPLTFEEAANLPIPDGFHVSMRKGKHPLPQGQWKLPPDVLTEKGGTVTLMPFPHEQPESKE